LVSVRRASRFSIRMVASLLLVPRAMGVRIGANTCSPNTLLQGCR